MKGETRAEFHQATMEMMLEHYRERTVQATRTMMDGLPQMYAKEARAIIKFYSEATSAEVWAQLAQIPDPDNPTQSLGQSWTDQWAALQNAVGGVSATPA